jgi:hypothetical protein
MNGGGFRHWINRYINLDQSLHRFKLTSECREPPAHLECAKWAPTASGETSI